MADEFENSSSHLSAAFATPLTLFKSDLFRSFSPRCPSRNIRVQPNPISRLLVTAEWQQEFLRPEPEQPSLQAIYEKFPSSYYQAYLLGLDPEQRTAYLTVHDRLTSSRPKYYATDQATPVPLPNPTHKASLLICDALSFLFGTQTNSEPLIATGASSITSFLPSSLCRCLGIDHIEANTVASKVFSSSSKFKNRADFASSILEACNARIAASAIVEAPSTIDNSQIQVGGLLYVEISKSSLFGEKIFSDAVAISVDAHFAVFMASISRSPCFLEKKICDDARVRVQNMHDTYMSCGNKPVIVKADQFGEVYVEKDLQSLPRLKGEIWEWSASDVWSLSTEELRDALRRNDIPVRRSEGRESILNKLTPLMDEVHRRELGIMIAADNGNYRVAADLQKDRSRRGRLLEELREAEQEGIWSKVASLAAEIKIIEEQTHDITAEPGSYNPDLDQDDWYRPCR